MLWVNIVLIIYLFQVITILILEFRHPAKAVAWLVILFIFPLIGFVLYYFVAKTYSSRRKMKRKGRKVMKEIHRDLHWQVEQASRVNGGHEAKGFAKSEVHAEFRLMGLLRNLPEFPISLFNQTTVLTDAPATFDALIAAMESAKDHIHFEFYTIRDDHIGRKFQELLIRKAKEGVKVRVLYDGIGSYQLSDGYVAKLHKAGVETGCFLPPLIAFIDKRLNYRNHRKIVVVDGIIGFLGGMNIGDEYLGGNPKLGYWRDTFLQIRGDAVYYLQHTFLTDWSFVKGEQPWESRYFPEQTERLPEEPIQIVVSGPDAHWDAILEVFFAAISTAKHRLYITTPYFIPDPSLTMALKTAAVSGVDVRIVLPRVADSKLVRWASLSYLEELLQAGVRFYQYQKGFIHAKVLLVDYNLAAVGTANMDLRSFFSNFELMAVLFDRGVIQRLEKDFWRDVKDSEELQLSVFQHRPRWQKALEILARLLSPLL